MARINYPTDFAGQQTLFAAILLKNAELGTKSPLIPFAKQQKFDLAKLAISASQAAEQDTLSKSLKLLSENSTQQRDLQFSPVWSHLKMEVHFLTGFFRGSERLLGEWGVTVDGKARIVYPAPFADEAALVKTFLAKHNSYDPGESPLQIFIDEYNAEHTADPIDVAADLLVVDAALTSETNKDKQSTDSQEATQKRDNLWAPVDKVIHLIGGFLMGLYPANSRKVAAWEFDVVEDAAGERTQISTIDPATDKKITSVTIPGNLINVGAVELQVIKGKGEKSETFTIKPGEELGMVKGFSTIIIRNFSTLEIGKIQVTVNK